MYPDPTLLLGKLDLVFPLIGFYDAPEAEPFAPLVRPGTGHACVFAYVKSWQAGKTLHLTADRFGCGGAEHWLCGVESRSREDFVRFLVDDEGLKASHDLMRQWLDHHQGYRQTHPHLLIGSLREAQYEYLKSVTFYVTPDQLGLVMLGAQYHSAPGDPPPVIAPFGSGCMQLATLFADLDVPQAIIGATDIAMRRYLAPDVLAFTVTRPMYERLCTLDENSFLGKPFWRDLVRARERPGPRPDRLSRLGGAAHGHHRGRASGGAGGRGTVAGAGQAGDLPQTALLTVSWS